MVCSKICNRYSLRGNSKFIDSLFEMIELMIFSRTTVIFAQSENVVPTSLSLVVQHPLIAYLLFFFGIYNLNKPTFGDHHDFCSAKKRWTWWDGHGQEVGKWYHASDLIAPLNLIAALVGTGSMDVDFRWLTATTKVTLRNAAGIPHISWGTVTPMGGD